LQNVWTDSTLYLPSEKNEPVKKIHVVLLILAILLIDQVFKFYIKTNFYLGENLTVFGTWFNLHFVENEGMAWGWKLGESGSWGKVVLTLFRLVAVFFGVYYLNKIIREKFHKGFIICVALIFAGAVGNLIDSMFYGLLFEESNPYTHNIAHFLPEKGYAGFLHGKVVDMLFFPIIDGTYPSWFPFWGGQPFLFFSPVFNIADTSISTGLIAILIFQNKFFVHDKVVAEKKTVSNEEVNPSNQQNIQETN
jgi:signal peptidase II